MPHVYPKNAPSPLMISILI